MRMRIRNLIALLAVFFICEFCSARPGELLVTQIPRYVRNPLPVGWRRSAHRAAVARSCDMESTMRYLKPSRSQQVRAKVNKIFAL